MSIIGRAMFMTPMALGNLSWPVSRSSKQELPWLKIEVRMDSAFFSDEIVSALDGMGIEFTLSVPF